VQNVPPVPPAQPKPPQGPPIPSMPGQLTPAQALDWEKWVQEQNISWHKWTQEQNTAWQKWLHEQKTKASERAHDKSNEFAAQTNQAAIQGGNLALRMGLIINGGAAVALLTFVGNLPTEQKRAIAATLDWFAWGVAAAVAALTCAYFTNYGVASMEHSRKWTDQPPYVINGATTPAWRNFVLIFRFLAIVAGVGSLVLFIVGMFYVRAALTKL
jgi:hypothetical protein